MEAGRELDALVAEKVMGLQVREVYIDSMLGMLPAQKDMRVISADGKSADHLPYYSKNIHAAWEVVEKLRLWVIPMKRGWFATQCKPLLVARKGLQVYEFETIGSNYCEDTGAIADTAPLAICLAALKAVGYTK